MRDFQRDAKNSYSSAQFSPDGRWVVTASADKTARVWNAESGELLQTFTHAGVINATEITADGKFVATASEDRTARLWNLATGAPIGDPLAHAAAVTAVSFSPDGRTVMTASADMSVRLWDTSRGKPQTGSLEHPALVSVARFSPDGQRLATGCQDGTVRLWNTRTGLPVSERLQHASAVINLQFSSDGQRLSTACSDGAACIWEVPAVPLPVPPWVPRLAEALAERRFNERGIIEPVSAKELEAAKRQFSESTASGVWTKWAKWYFADSSTRTISPFTAVTLPDYVQHRTEENCVGSLREAVNLAPTNGVALARLARALMHDYPQVDSPQALEADWCSRSAMRFAPQTFEVLCARAEVLDQNGRLPEALDIMERALEQQPVDADFWVWCGSLQEKTSAFARAYEAYSKAASLAGTNSWADYGIWSRAMLKRAALLRKQGRLAEAQKDILLVHRIPPRDQAISNNLVDLSDHYNGGLTHAWDPDRRQGNDLSEFSRVQKLAGVDFDIRGLIQLSGSLWKNQFPEIVRGIRVAQRCRRLHLLQSARGYLEPEGIPIAKFVVHYMGGQQVEIPVIYGQTVRLWRVQSDSKRETSNAVEAWTGSNPVAGAIRIFKSTWENPRPQEEIATIDFVSLNRTAVPFLIAITAKSD